MGLNTKLIVQKRVLIYLELFFTIPLIFLPSVKANFFQPEFPETIFNLIKNLVISYFITAIVETFVITNIFVISKELVLMVFWVNFITNPATQLCVWTLYFISTFPILLIVIIIAEFTAIILESTLLIEKMQKLEIEYKPSKVYFVVFFANLLTVSLVVIPIVMWPPIFLS